MSDRRKYFRLAAHLPMDIIVPVAVAPDKKLRRLSSNLSAGGFYFQSHIDDGVAPGQKINYRIAIPPGVGRMPREGVLEGQATVLRVDPVPRITSESNTVGVACAFDAPLRFS